MVAAAFWCQLACAALLVATSVTGVVGALQYHQLFGEAVAPLTTLSLRYAAVPLAWGAGLLAVALQLRRGGRLAYRLSLAGLLLPLPIALTLILCTSGFAGRTVSFGYLADDPDAIARLERMTTTTTAAGGVAGLLAAGALLLLVSTVALLLTPAARAFFRPPARRTGTGPPTR